MVIGLRGPAAFSAWLLMAPTLKCGGVQNGGPGVWDGGPCQPNAPNLAGTYQCDGKMNAECQAWAESVAIGAFGWSSCYVHDNFGTACTSNPDCGGGAGGCCGSLPQRCQEGEVCASDTPSGPHHCIEACLGVPPEAGAD